MFSSHGFPLVQAFLGARELRSRGNGFGSSGQRLIQTRRPALGRREAIARGNHCYLSPRKDRPGVGVMARLRDPKCFAGADFCTAPLLVWRGRLLPETLLHLAPPTQRQNAER